MSATLFRLEALAQLRTPAVLLSTLLMLGLCVFIIPFALGPELDLLQRVGSSVLWLAVLFACLTNADRTFADAARDGLIDQWRLSTLPLLHIVLTRIVVFWLMTLIPVLIAVPFALIVLGQPAGMIPVTWLIVGAGSLSLVMLQSLAAALTLGLKRSLPLVVLLVIPLALPVLIFGAGALQAASLGEAFRAPLLLAMALALVLSVVCPPLIAATIRHAHGGDA